MTLSVSTRCRYISGMNVGRSISIKLDTSSLKINPPLLYQTQFHSFGLEEGCCFSRTCYNSTMLSRYTLGMLQIFRGSFLGIGTSGPNLCILVMLITRPVYISKSYWVVLSGNKKPIWHFISVKTPLNKSFIITPYNYIGHSITYMHPFENGLFI